MLINVLVAIIYVINILLYKMSSFGVFYMKYQNEVI